MSITDPAQLIDEFKKSGEFDRLRRELLSQFKNTESIGTFMSRVQDIVQQRLAEDGRLQYMPPEAVHSELMQDMERFPLVQRAAADLPALSDPSFNASIRRSLERLLRNGPSLDDVRKPNGEEEEMGDDDDDDDDDDVRMDDAEGSDSESSSDDEEEEHEPGHEHESEDDHDQGRGPGGVPSETALQDSDDMPQNERIRQQPIDPSISPDTHNKPHATVNGVTTTPSSDYNPRAPSASPIQEDIVDAQHASTSTSGT